MFKKLIIGLAASLLSLAAYATGYQVIPPSPFTK
jgi:hypothetical protein